MIYITGDIHGDPWRVVKLCRIVSPTPDDVIVLLGDVGANYYGEKKDTPVKAMLDMNDVKILCIHGNHEQRPWKVDGYKLTEWRGGKVWVQEDFPNLLFAKDGEIFDLEGHKCIVIGGAYSVDKFYRLECGYGWWEDEQPSDEIKAYVEKQLSTNEVDIVLSHTCPFKYEPREAFLSGIDQSQVDDSTERWLDTIEERLDYKAWYCGHWHINKRIDRIRFLYDGIEMLGEYKEET